MTSWKILGINETKDKDIIKDAYRQLLSVTNPEDDPQKFMELRRAYEEAIEWSDKEEDTEIDDSLVGEWIGEVQEIYEDFEERINPENWKNLLSEDVCVRLDMKIEARDALLIFLTENYNLPQCIWKMIDEAFDIIESKDELYDIFPKEYIDNAIISSIKYKDVLDYDLFNLYSMADFDEFIGLYYYLVKAVKEHDYTECDRIFIKMDEMGEVHPYSEIERVKYLISKKEINKAYNLASRLYSEYPDNEQIIYIYAEASFVNDMAEEAMELFNKVLNINPDNYYAKVGRADCLMKKNEYEKAKDIYIELHKENPYDAYLKEYVENANNAIIQKYENMKIEELNSKELIDLGWCYLQNNKAEDALILANYAKPEDDEYEYYNYVGRCYFYLHDYDNALSNINQWIDVMKKLDDDSESNRNRKGRIGYAYELLSQLCDQKGEKKEAIKYIDMAIEINPSDEGHMEAKARLLLEIKEYENCILICDELLNINDNAFIAFYLKGVAFYKQRKYVNALDEFTQSTKCYPFYLPAYLYRIKILIKYGEYDKADENLDYLDEHLVQSDSILFYRTKNEYDRQITAKNDKDKLEDNEIINIDYERYRSTFEEIIDRYDQKNTDIFEIDAVYYEVASTYMSEENYSKAIYYATKAADINEDNINAIMCLAYAYEKVKEYRLAIAANEKLLELNPMHFNANNRIAELHEEFYEYEDSIKYHTRQLEISNSLYCHLSRGLAFLRLDRFEEARKDFLSAIEGNPNNPHPYNNIGASYQYEDNYEEALRYYRMAVEHIDSEPTPLPYRNMATVYMRMKETDKAIECYKENIKLFNRAYDYEEMALAYFEALRFKEAVEAYTKRCKYLNDDKSESMIELYVWVGNCNLSLGAEKTALKYFEKAIEEGLKIGLKYADAYIKIAEFYILKQKYSMAVKYYSEIESNDVLNVVNLADYAYALQNSGDNEKSEKMLKKAFDEAFSMDERHLYELSLKYYRIGYCYTIKGDFAKAKEFYQKAIANRKCNTCDFPKCSEACGGMAFMYELMGNYPMAAAYYKEALGIAPSNISYIYGYKRVTEMNAEYKTICADLKK